MGRLPGPVVSSRCDYLFEDGQHLRDEAGLKLSLGHAGQCHLGLPPQINILGLTHQATQLCGQTCHFVTGLQGAASEAPSRISYCRLNIM